MKAEKLFYLFIFFDCRNIYIYIYEYQPEYKDRQWDRSRIEIK